MNTAPLPEPDRARLEALVASEGEAATIRKLAVPKNTVTRALARLPIRPGSVLIIRAALEAAERGNRG